MKMFFAATLLASTLALSACGDDATETSGTAPAGQNATESETRQAVDALRDAGRETGEAASAAASDLRDAAAPALERAQEAGAEALESAQQGLDNLTRGAACQTARAANDAEGVAANC